MGLFDRKYYPLVEPEFWTLDAPDLAWLRNPINFNEMHAILGWAANWVDHEIERGVADRVVGLVAQIVTPDVEDLLGDGLSGVRRAAAMGYGIAVKERDLGLPRPGKVHATTMCAKVAYVPEGDGIGEDELPGVGYSSAMLADFAKRCGYYNARTHLG